MRGRFALTVTRLLRSYADIFFAKRYGHRAIVLETMAAVPRIVWSAISKSRRSSAPHSIWRTSMAVVQPTSPPRRSQGGTGTCRLDALSSAAARRIALPCAPSARDETGRRRGMRSSRCAGRYAIRFIRLQTGPLRHALPADSCPSPPRQPVRRAVRCLCARGTSGRGGLPRTDSQ